jgi:hypothetical protein
MPRFSQKQNGTGSRRLGHALFFPLFPLLGRASGRMFGLGVPKFPCAAGKFRR